MKNLFKLCQKQIHLFENPSYRFMKSDNPDKLQKWNNLSIYEKTSSLLVFQEDLKNEKNKMILQQFYNELINNIQDLHEHDIYYVLQFQKNNKEQDRDLQKNLINQLMKHKQSQLLQQTIDMYKFDYYLFDKDQIQQQICDSKDCVNYMIDLVYIALQQKIDTKHYFAKYIKIVSQQKFVVDPLKNLVNLHNLHNFTSLAKQKHHQKSIENLLKFFDKKIMPQRLLYFDNDDLICDLLGFYEQNTQLFEKQSFMLDFFYNKLIQIILINNQENLSVYIIHFLSKHKQERIQDHQIDQILKYFEQHFESYLLKEQLLIIEAFSHFVNQQKIKDNNSSYLQVLQYSKYLLKGKDFDDECINIMKNIKKINPDFYLLN